MSDVRAVSVRRQGRQKATVKVATVKVIGRPSREAADPLTLELASSADRSVQAHLATWGVMHDRAVQWVLTRRTCIHEVVRS